MPGLGLAIGVVMKLLRMEVPRKQQAKKARKKGRKRKHKKDDDEEALAIGTI